MLLKKVGASDQLWLLDEKGQEILNDLFAQTITTLFNDFNDLALGNGFEMPPLGKRKVP